MTIACACNQPITLTPAGNIPKAHADCPWQMEGTNAAAMADRMRAREEGDRAAS